MRHLLNELRRLYDADRTSTEPWPGHASVEFMRAVREHFLWLLDQASRAEQLERERDAWRRVAQDYTPGGSEFTTPEACAAYVRDLRDRQHNLIAKSIREKREAEARAEAAERRVGELEEAQRGPRSVINSLLASAHNYEGLPDSHLLELIWADDPRPGSAELGDQYITLGELRRAARSLSEQEKTDVQR